MGIVELVFVLLPPVLRISELLLNFVSACLYTAKDGTTYSCLGLEFVANSAIPTVSNTKACKPSTASTRYFTDILPHVRLHIDVGTLGKGFSNNSWVPMNTSFSSKYALMIGADRMLSCSNGTTSRPSSMSSDLAESEAVDALWVLTDM